MDRTSMGLGLDMDRTWIGHVASMSHPVPSMSHPCPIHVTSMSHPRLIHVLPMSHPCPLDVPSMSHPWPINFLSMLFPCLMRTLWAALAWRGRETARPNRGNRKPGNCKSGNSNLETCKTASPEIRKLGNSIWQPRTPGHLEHTPKPANLKNGKFVSPETRTRNPNSQTRKNRKSANQYTRKVGIPQTRSRILESLETRKARYLPNRRTANLETQKPKESDLKIKNMTFVAWGRG